MVQNVLPTEGHEGIFDDRATELGVCICGCGQPMVFYKDDASICEEQTVEVRDNLYEAEAREIMQTLGRPFQGFAVLNLRDGTFTSYLVENDDRSQ